MKKEINNVSFVLAFILGIGFVIFSLFTKDDTLWVISFSIAFICLLITFIAGEYIRKQPTEDIDWIKENAELLGKMGVEIMSQKGLVIVKEGDGYSAWHSDYKGITVQVNDINQIPDEMAKSLKVMIDFYIEENEYTLYHHEKCKK